MSDPLLGLSAEPRRLDAAAAAAGAQGVLVKDILSAEEELRVRAGAQQQSARLGQALHAARSQKVFCCLAPSCLPAAVFVHCRACCVSYTHSAWRSLRGFTRHACQPLAAHTTWVMHMHHASCTCII